MFVHIRFAVEFIDDDDRGNGMHGGVSWWCSAFLSVGRETEALEQEGGIQELHTTEGLAKDARCFRHWSAW